MYLGLLLERIAHSMTSLSLVLDHTEGSSLRVVVGFQGALVHLYCEFSSGFTRVFVQIWLVWQPPYHFELNHDFVMDWYACKQRGKALHMTNQALMLCGPKIISWDNLDFLHMSILKSPIRNHHRTPCKRIEAFQRVFIRFPCAASYA